MPLNSYKKSEAKTEKLEFITVENENNTGEFEPNIWEGAARSYSELKRFTNSSRIANLVIPAIFVCLGVLLIYNSIKPEIITAIEEQNGLLEQGTATPVAENYINLAQYVSNPVGMDQVNAKALEQNVLQVDQVSNNYDGIFYISIPSIGIEQLPVQSNVNSTDENVYKSVLENSLAHFEDTGLPISDVNNNIVIYGHSATSNYGASPSDPEVAFSFLSDLKVGDEIYIDMEGERYTFRMQRSKIVEPTDVSIINGKYNKKELTLFTCWPPGNNSHRQVVTARPV